MRQQFRDTAFFSGIVLVLLGSLASAQNSFKHEPEVGTIKRARNLLVSSLDDRLPKVTLEFFLQYEAEGAPIRWSVENCDQQDRNRVASICVHAEVALKQNRSATVVVSLGEVGTRSANAPSISSVTVTDQSGSVHEVPRLGDLPMELHRRLPSLPRSPRDLPPPAAEA